MPAPRGSLEGGGGAILITAVRPGCLAAGHNIVTLYELVTVQCQSYVTFITILGGKKVFKLLLNIFKIEFTE